MPSTCKCLKRKLPELLKIVKQMKKCKKKKTTAAPASKPKRKPASKPKSKPFSARKIWVNGRRGERTGRPGYIKLYGFNKKEIIMCPEAKDKTVKELKAYMRSQDYEIDSSARKVALIKKVCNPNGVGRCSASEEAPALFTDNFLLDEALLE